MKHLLKLISIGVASLLMGSCNRATLIEHGDLKLSVDHNMRLKVESRNRQTAPFFADFQNADALYAAEFTAEQFRVSKTKKQTEEGAVRYTISGEFAHNGYKVEKEMVITAHKGIDNMVTIQTTYKNSGSKEFVVTGWKSNELRMAAEEEVWAFQPTSSSRRADWLLPITKGFYQQNYLGMNDSDYGGGIPLVYMWRKDGGFYTGISETTLKLASMPVEWLPASPYATVEVRFDYPNRRTMAAGDTLALFETYLGVAVGDYYNPLNSFTALMKQKGLEFPESNKEAYEPVWCAWGYERTFTIQEIIGTLAKVKEVGFKWVDVDDGFQIAEGDWDTNERFPGGDKDMRRITDAIHSHGLKAKLWWAPLAADPGTKVLREHPEVLLKQKDGSPQWITWWNSFYMSPVNPVTEQITNKLLEQFIVTWNFDGLKLDGQHLNCAAPDYNGASKLDFPEQSIELMPKYFENIYKKTLEYKEYAVVQFCPCGCAINYYMIPHMNQAVSSDPLNSRQIRLKGKAYRAINDKLAYYADHIELSDNGDDFGTQMGIGAVIGSKFTYPKNNPNVKNDYLLTPAKERELKRWITLYNEKMISMGSYLNLYDIAYDKPEGHVIKKGESLYYAFYAESWSGAEIELRGLDPALTYTICEYTTDEKRSYTIQGNNPTIKPVFVRNYLIEATPAK